MAQAVCHSLWNTSDHLVDGVDSINMKACYPASPQDYTAYEPKPEHCGALASVNNDSAEPSHADPLVSHALSYLNGGGGSGKTTRANEVFRGRNPLVLTPTHRLAKEIRSRASTHRRTTASSGGRARKIGLQTAYAGCYLGRGLHSPQGCARDLPRLACSERCSGCLLW